MWWLWTVPALAQHASEPQPLLFEDQVDVLDGLAAQTAWFPSKGAPVSIRLFLDTSGGVQTTVEATSELTWSDAVPGELSHRLVGAAGGGTMVLDATAEVGAEVKVDIGGVFTGTVPLLRQSATWLDQSSFDGLLLAGGQEAATVGDGLQPITLSFRVSVISGVDLVVGVDVVPQLDVALAGVEVRTDGAGGQGVQELEGGWVDLPTDPQRPGQLGLSSIWATEWSSDLALVLSPSLDLFTPVGTFTVVQFDSELPLATVDEARDLEAFVVHPLPVIEGPVEAYDFGEVPLTSQATWQVPLRNLGALAVDGAVEVVGDRSFEVFPGDVAVLAQGDDGVVVTFAPSEPGPVEALLRLTTNDPTAPLIEVALTGTGVAPDGSGDSDAIPVTSCGCQSGGGGAGLAVLALLAVARRRR
ncbi:MAG: hypothetical protein KTR31_24255 [Myxococcales bacterium]|nr:hypothetical protein [Myxococcales bacterium]